MSNCEPVRIVGAGPTGALLAILLQRRGHAVELYESRPDPALKSGESGRSINLALADRGMALAGAVLALAVLFIVGNTIRLAIENRREEIIITKLVGATDAFIRRPFIYGGIWYGLVGGLIALLIVDGVLWGMSGPVARLAALYQSGFRLGMIGWAAGLAVLLAGAALGWLGAWLALGKHLRRIEPG